jgi:hypothetical protein
MDYITILNDDVIFEISKAILIHIRDIDTVVNLTKAYSSFDRVLSSNAVYHILLQDKNLIDMFNKSVYDNWLSKYTAYNAIVDVVTASAPIISLLKSGVDLYSDLMRPYRSMTAPPNLNILEVRGTSSVDMEEVLYSYNQWMQSNRVDNKHGYTVQIIINQDNNKLFINIAYLNYDDVMDDIRYEVDEYYVSILIMKFLYNGMKITNVEGDIYDDVQEL